MLKLCTFLLLTCVGLAFGQVTPNSVTVTASRNTNIQPDQVVFGVNVDTPVDATRDDVLAALQGSGFRVANFSGVRSIQSFNGRQTTTVLEWSFLLQSAISTMKSTTGLLSAVQKSMAQNNKSFSMSFGVQGTQVSQQAQQSQPCSVPDLVADVRAQAQKMASAAGATVGSVMAITSATAVTDPGGNPFVQPSFSPVCSLTVKFALSGGF